MRLLMMVILSLSFWGGLSQAQVNGMHELKSQANWKAFRSTKGYLNYSDILSYEQFIRLPEKRQLQAIRFPKDFVRDWQEATLNRYAELIENEIPQLELNIKFFQSEVDRYLSWSETAEIRKRYLPGAEEGLRVSRAELKVAQEKSIQHLEAYNKFLGYFAVVDQWKTFMKPSGNEVLFMNPRVSRLMKKPTPVMPLNQEVGIYVTKEKSYLDINRQGRLVPAKRAQ